MLKRFKSSFLPTGSIGCVWKLSDALFALIILFFLIDVSLLRYLFFQPHFLQQSNILTKESLPILRSAGSVLFTNISSNQEEESPITAANNPLVAPITPTTYPNFGAFEGKKADIKIPVYVIESSSKSAKTSSMTSQLTSDRYVVHQIKRSRIQTLGIEILKKDINMPETKPDDVSAIISHLQAIYIASHDDDDETNHPYALIVEDDASFEFNVTSWYDLIADAPKDFAMLNIAPAGATAMEVLYKSLSQDVHDLLNNGKIPPDSLFWSDVKPKDYTVWSTKGYIINREVIKGEIQRYITVSKDSDMITGVRFTVPPGLEGCRKKPCDLPFPLVPEVYLHLLFAPVFISKVPIINTNNINSPSNVLVQRALNYPRVSQIIKRMKEQDMEVLPFYLS